ncbi:uncharacterized protein LOC144439269 [Glandiceps talaboti]
MATSHTSQHDRFSQTSLPFGDRKFYQLPQDDSKQQSFLPKKKNLEGNAKFIKYIDENVIGRDALFSAPYGRRQAVYCDYTASGRSLKFIEEYIQEQVLSMYGNTHTTTTVTSLQTTLYRHEARDIVRNAVNASEHDAVIFVGSGCTGAVHKLISALHLHKPPVVFVGPYEHHSNLLPWRELGAQIVRINENSDGLVDIGNLEDQLKKWQGCGRQLIGCFAAASNVTGILTDVNTITICLHRYGALAFWDYATAGPYVQIDMNPVITSGDQSLVYKDAIFISPHKFIGGVQTPGVLVAKKNLFQNQVPTGGGGGSVFFVTRETHRYLQQVEMREEGGTPDIVGSVRAGLVFQLKEAVGSDIIMEKEHALCRKALEVWKHSPNLVLLGNTDVPRLPIFSFLIKHPISGQFLHHNFICAVLNDVFGVQARGGCACAGPYAQDLLGIDEELALRIEAVLLEDSRLDRIHLRRYTEYSEREILRPGFARLNLPYFMSDDSVDFVIKAVAMVAEHGWKLLPQYMFNPETGEWKHRHHQVFQDRRWLGHISYQDNAMHYSNPIVHREKGKLPANHKECLQFAEEIFAKASKVKVQLPDQTLLFDEECEKLRWFMLPSEASYFITHKATSSKSGNIAVPFHPPQWPLLHQRETKPGEESRNMYSEEVEKDTTNTKKVVVYSTTQQFTRTIEDGFIDEAGLEKRCQPSVIRQGRNTDTEQQVTANNEDESDVRGVKDRLVPSVNRELSRQEDPIKGTDKTQMKEESVDECPRLQSDEDTQTGKTLNPATVLPPQQFETEVSTQDTPTPVTHTAAILSTLTAGVDNRTMQTKEVSTFQPQNNDLKVTDMNDINGECNRSEGKGQPQKMKWDWPCLLTGSRSSINENASSKTKVVTDSQQSSDVLNGRSNIEKETTSNVTAPCRGRKSNIDPLRPRFHAPPKNLFKAAVQALEEYSMIQNKDRVLVCLSGGKDSLSLLHTLRQYQYYAKNKGITFDLGAVTVDPLTSSYDPSPLKDYLKTLGLQYFYEEQGILEQAKSLAICESICSFCSRMKRGRLYACARREGYNVLAMGQHLDDLAESFLMSAFHNGLLRTMKANYIVREGDLRVIRPLVYVREKDTRQFAEQAKLPVIPENCPACFDAPKERHRTKQLLAAQEILFPDLYHSLLTAMKPLMAIDRTGLESTLRNKKGDLNILQTQQNGNNNDDDDDDDDDDKLFDL